MQNITTRLEFSEQLDKSRSLLIPKFQQLCLSSMKYLEGAYFQQFGFKMAST